MPARLPVGNDRSQFAIRKTEYALKLAGTVFIVTVTLSGYINLDNSYNLVARLLSVLQTNELRR